MKARTKEKLKKILKTPAVLGAALGTIAVSAIPGVLSFVNMKKSNKEFSSIESKMISEYVLPAGGFDEYKNQYIQKANEAFDNGFINEKDLEFEIEKTEKDDFKIQYGFDTELYPEEVSNQYKSLLKQKDRAETTFIFCSAGSFAISAIIGFVIAGIKEEDTQIFGVKVFASSFGLAPIVVAMETNKAFENNEKDTCLTL